MYLSFPLDNVCFFICLVVDRLPNASFFLISWTVLFAICTIWQMMACALVASPLDSSIAHSGFQGALPLDTTLPRIFTLSCHRLGPIISFFLCCWLVEMLGSPKETFVWLEDNYFQVIIGHPLSYLSISHLSRRVCLASCLEQTTSWETTILSPSWTPTLLSLSPIFQDRFVWHHASGEHFSCRSFHLIGFLSQLP